MSANDNGEASRKLVANERTKLTATWLNSIAAAAVAVGGIGPTIAAATGAMSLTLAAVLIPTWLAGGAILHWSARAVLGRLKDLP